jgi:CRISPR-associated protein Csd1
MLLQRLVEWAAEHGDGPPFHRELEFSWQVELDRGGQLRSEELTPLVQAGERGHLRGVMHRVPVAVRAFGVAPQLAADDVQYVLGWADEGSKPERVAQCHGEFVDLIRRWAGSDAGAGDPVAQAVWAFYRDGQAKRVRPPDGVTVKSKQRVMIAVDGVPATTAPSVVPFWTAEVARRKGGAVSGLCLVCGRTGPLLDTVPGKVPSHLVPLATNDAALVSINEAVFGYGLTKQLGGNTPLCLACGDAITTGLRGVLESPHAVSYGGQDSRLAWWVAGASTVDAMDLIYTPDPEQIADLIASVHTGRRPGGADPARFCALTVGGNVARVVVRDWVEMPLRDLNEHVAEWFTHTEIVPRWRDDPRHHGLQQLARCTGRWLRRERGYARFGAKGADRPESVHRDLLRAAIRGVPLPPSLLAHLVHRVCTDGRLDAPRAALLRLALTRLPDTGVTPMPSLDPSNTDPAYVAGRAFAVIESLQDAASDGQLNTTYADRYFAGAVTNPRAAIVSGRRDAAAWLRKLRRTKRGLAVTFDKRLTEIFALIDAEPGLPATTTLREQALFLLGYHHQRAHQFAPRPSTEPESTVGETE